MKKIVLIALALCAASQFASTAKAAHIYEVTCTAAACLPFTQTNSYVLQEVVNTAASHSAVVGDGVEIYHLKQLNPCKYDYMIFTVTNVPTLNSGDIQYTMGGVLNDCI